MFLVLAVLLISALVDFSYLVIDPRQSSRRAATQGAGSR